MLNLSQQIAVLSGIWAILSIAMLAIMDSLNLEYFFVLCLLGFLLILILFSPLISRPGWRVRADFLLVLGVFVFGMIIAGKIWAIIGMRLY